MSQNISKNINILQNDIIRPPPQANGNVKRRMTSSMFFLDEEPAFTDSETELSESDITECLEVNMPIYSGSQVIKIIDNGQTKHCSDMEVQCEILSTKSSLKELIKMCSNLDATGEYEELISVCKKLNNGIGHNHNVYKDKSAKLDPIINSPSRSGKTTLKPVSLRKGLFKAKKVADVRKSHRIRNTRKRSHLNGIHEDNSSRNMKRPDKEKQIGHDANDFLKPNDQISRSIIKSLARNWMKPNNSFSVLEKSLCEQNYLSLQHQKKRRLYSPSQWLEEFIEHNKRDL